MNKMREHLLESREQEDKALFEKIKDNPKPDIIDLWSLSEERFIDWRKKNDFPVLLNHFDKTLELFKEWKQENKLTNELIIGTGFITPFLERKKESADKNLFLTRQKWDGNKEAIFINYAKREGKEKILGTDYEFGYLQTFVSYLDWLVAKGKGQQILYLNSRHAPNSPMERVFIHADVYANKSDFELLKMGGIELPVDPYGLLSRGKRLEFANLCGLRMEGKVNFGELGNLSCHYCACDNWVMEGFDMPMVILEHCTVANLNMISSTLRQWSFYDCQVTGDFIHSKIINTAIINGYFNPVMLDCTLSNAHIKRDPVIPDANYEGYKTFKKIYQAQGDDSIAKHYFILENEFVRQGLKGWRYITKTLSYYYWEYGRKPHRIIYFSLAIILVFGLAYWLFRDHIALNSTAIKHFNLGDGFYFSTITFTTLGYGDLSPLGGLRVLASIEAFLGMINMGFLIAGYSNNKY